MAPFNQSTTNFKTNFYTGPHTSSTTRYNIRSASWTPYTLPTSCGSRLGSTYSSTSLLPSTYISRGNINGNGMYRSRSSSRRRLEQLDQFRRSESDTKMNIFKEVYTPSTCSSNYRLNLDRTPFQSASTYSLRSLENLGKDSQSELNENENQGTCVKKKGKGNLKKNNENNNFLIQRRGSFVNKRKTWRDLNVIDRIEELAKPKGNPPGFQRQFRSPYWSHKHHVCRDECTGQIMVEENPHIEKLAEPIWKCGQWYGKRHCIWECDCPWEHSEYCRDGQPLDPEEIDWDRLAKPKGHCPLTKEMTFEVSRGALQAKATRRLEKLAMPKKIVDCNEYYMWLLRTKTDNEPKLKPVKRLSIDKIELTDARIFLRCDLDFTDCKNLKAKLDKILPTIRYALEKEAKCVIIGSHCGEPRGRRDPKFSMKCVAKQLQDVLGREVVFLDDCVGPEARALCEDPEPGSLFFFENLRFNPEEDGGGLNEHGEEFVCTKEEVKLFRAKLFSSCDIYVQDAFTNLVEATSTTVGVKNQDRAYGLNIKEELDAYNEFVTNPSKPMVAVVGGSFKDMIDVVYNIMGKADEVLLGGEIAQIFLKTLKGIDIGTTQSSPAKEKKVVSTMARAKDINCVVSLPADFVVRNVNKPEEYFTVLSKLDVEPWYDIVDIGKITRQCYVATINEAASVVWCGDMGVLLDGSCAIGTAISEGTTERGMESYIMNEETYASFKSVCPNGKITAVTGDGQVTAMLLHRKLPKGLAGLSPWRKTMKKSSLAPEVVSNKPTSLDKAGYRMETGLDRLCIGGMNVEDKRVLILCDMTVPMTNHVILDNYRLRMVIPSVKWVLKRGAKLVIILANFKPHHSMFAPPKRKMEVPSLKPICDEMGKLLNRPIIFVPECTGKVVDEAVKKAHPGSVLMLDNILNSREEKMTFLMGVEGEGRARPPEAVASFCESLSNICDIYVNDAFRIMADDRSSITGCMHKQRPCGFLVKNELKYLSKTLNNPPRRFVAIIGGSKIFEKIEMMRGLLRDVDEIIVAGLLGLHLLLVDQGMPLGKSFDRSIQLTDLEQLLEMAKENNVKLYYPVDMILSNIELSDIPKLHPDGGGNMKQVSSSEGVLPGYMCVDVGSKTASLFSRVIKRAKLVLWSGVIGVTEVKAFSKGTRAIYDTIVNRTKSQELISIVGGRSVSYFVHNIDPNHEGLSHVTTGYHVALRLLSEKRLTGLRFLSYQNQPRVMSMNRLSMDQAEVKDKRVLLRCDFNPPLRSSTEEDVILKEHLNTIKNILKKGATSVVVFGSMGEPRGKRDDVLSLSPIKVLLEKQLRMEIPFFDKGLTDSVESTLVRPEMGKVYMFENMRFNPEEEGYETNAMDRRTNIGYDVIEAYRTRLSKCGDILVCEGVDSLALADSSVMGINLEKRSVGPHLKLELTKFAQLMPKIDTPILSIVGGQDDITSRIINLYDMMDYVTDIIIMGGVAFTFLKVVQGMAIGKTPFDNNAAKLVPRVMKKAGVTGVNLYFPVDFKVPVPVEPVEEGQEPPEEEPPETVKAENGIPEARKAMDIGDDSVAKFNELIQEAKTIFYYGAAGIYQQEEFAAGTRAILQTISEVTEEGTISIAYGYRTAICLNTLEAVAGFSHVSYGDTLIMNLLKRHPLPGLAALSLPPEKPLSVMSITQITLKGQKVLIRFDLDVPTVEGVVLETDKIEKAIPTIRYCLDKEATAVIIAGFRGDPKGYKNSYLSMRPLVAEFEHFLEKDVIFLDNPCSGKSRMQLDEVAPGSVFLLENLLFYPAEVGEDEGVPDILENASSQDIKADGPDGDHQEEQDVKRQNIDKLMWELMTPKTIEQYTREIGDLADVFVMDDVKHLKGAYTSNIGFDLPLKVAGPILVDFLRQGPAIDYPKTIGVANLTPAPKEPK